MLIKELSFLLFSLLISGLLYPAWIDLLYRYKLQEKVSGLTPKNHRKKKGTPTMGGTVFILVLFVITLLFNYSQSQTLFPLFIIMAASSLGLIEDLYKAYTRSDLRESIRINLNKFISRSNFKLRLYDLWLLPWNLFRELARTFASTSDTKLKPHYKLSLQMVISAFLSLWIYFRLSWTTLWLPLLGELELGIFYPIFIFFFFIFILNAVAITDGLDGLAAGLGIISLCAFWVLSSVFNYGGLSLFTATLIGALLSFLYFNIFPARIFMGDIGSYGISSAIFMIALMLRREIALLPICAVFIVDGGLSGLVQQFSMRFYKKRIFKMAPLHHHFELLGWLEPKVVMRFWLFGAIFAFLGITIALL